MRYIDEATWDRREIYQWFSAAKAPFYEIAFPIDVTYLKQYTKQQGISFYYALVYVCTEVLSGIDAFLYKIRPDGIVRHDRLHPGTTDMTPGTGRFHITMVAQEGAMEEYCRRAHQVSRQQTCFINKSPVPEDQLIYYTCLPWLPFTALSNVQPDNRDDSIPRVTFGKFTEENGRLTMPCSILVNHRLIDGYHVGFFYEQLGQKLESFCDLLNS